MRVHHYQLLHTFAQFLKAMEACFLPGELKVIFEKWKGAGMQLPQPI
jgi:hypothetical protein